MINEMMMINSQFIIPCSLFDILNVTPQRPDDDFFHAGVG